MEAIIKELKLKKFLNKYYFRIELCDIDGCTYVVDKPFLSNPIDFRKQVFGIMSAVGSYDLMKLATDDPNKNKVLVMGPSSRGIEILSNSDNTWLTFDDEKDVYVSLKNEKKKHKRLEKLVKENRTNISIEEGNIESIESASGCFQLLFMGKSLSKYYITSQIYYGFGKPINIGDEKNVDNTKRSAGWFTSFIVSLMNFYGIDDLLQFGGKKDKLPVVEMSVSDNNEVRTITNPNTGLGLSITDKYNIINVFEAENIKVK